MTQNDDDPGQVGALRSFLQRAEVRLSTLHRIAGVFLNGAGLLVLFPILVTSVVRDLVRFVLFESFAPVFQLVFVISLLAVSFLPMYALVLLFAELVQFYYVPRAALAVGAIPKTKQSFLPRFTLTAIALPKDEQDERTGRAIYSEQYTGDMAGFLIPGSDNKRDYYKQIYNASGPSILPPGRKPADVWDTNNSIRDLREVAWLGVALGVAGFHERTLPQEVAKMEFSIARHIVFLRTLVMRYFKALLLLIVSTLALALASSFLPPVLPASAPQNHRMDQHQRLATEAPTSSPERDPTMDRVSPNTTVLNSEPSQSPRVPFGLNSTAWSVMVLTTFFLLWSLATWKAVKFPIKWIYALAPQAENFEWEYKADPKLTIFEKNVWHAVILVAVINAYAFSVFWISKSLATPEWLWVAGAPFLCICYTLLFAIPSFRKQRAQALEDARDAENSIDAVIDTLTRKTASGDSAPAAAAPIGG